MQVVIITEWKNALKSFDIFRDMMKNKATHTHATVVAERLGHSYIKMTLNTYIHVLPDMQRQAVDD